jgi:cell division inhibitor SepF
MSLWKKTMDYLGLGPDDAYDDYYDDADADPAGRPPRGTRDNDARSSRGWEAEGEQGERAASARPSYPSRDFDPSATRRGTASAGASGRNDDSGIQIRPIQPPPPTSRPTAGGTMEPHTVRPRRFDQAQEVADKFKDGQPVIMNLEGTDRNVARRLIDFASGICYALDGSMEKVATGVYLLKPAHTRPAHHDDYAD